MSMSLEGILTSGGILEGSDLCSYAASDAAKVLATNWIAARSHVRTEELIKDVDDVVTLLEAWKKSLVGKEF